MLFNAGFRQYGVVGDALHFQLLQERLEPAARTSKPM
jgi:hypothetical protein